MLTKTKKAAAPTGKKLIKKSVKGAAVKPTAKLQKAKLLPKVEASIPNPDHFTIRGAVILRDVRFPPDHPIYPKMNHKYIPPHTYYCIDKQTREIHSLITIMPDGKDTHTGTIVGWSSCGTCHNYLHRCACAEGMFVCRSVEWIYDKTVATLAGEDFEPNHPNYHGSFRNLQAASRSKVAKQPYKPWKRDTSTPAPTTVPTSDSVPSVPFSDTGKPLRKSLDKSGSKSGSRPPAKLLKKSVAKTAKQTESVKRASDLFKNGKIDNTALDASASKLSKSSEDQVRKLLTKSAAATTRKGPLKKAKNKR